MFQTFDVIVLVLYILVVLGIGFYFSKKAKTPEGFMVGGRSMSGFSVGLSIVGTLLSSVSFIAYAGKAYDSNWNAYVFSITVVMVAFVAVGVFLPFYRKLGIISAYEFLEDRFGYWDRLYGGVSFIMYQIGRVGVILYLLCLPLHHLLGWDMVTLIVVTGIFTTGYTFVGGIEAVIWTDVTQVFVLFGGAVLCGMILLTSVPEGPSQVFSIAGQYDKMSLGTFAFDFTNSSFWLVMVFGITENLRNFGVDQTYIQRYVATKSDKEAAKSVWLGALAYVPLTLLFFMIGTGLFVFYQVYPDPALPEKAAAVFPYFIVTELPDGVRGLLIAALFAAAMSSLSSSINCVATITVEDFTKRFSKRRLTDKQIVMYLRIVTIIFGITGTMTAIAMMSVKTALDISWQISGIFGGGILGLFLLGIFTKKIGNAAAVPAVILSMIAISWITFNESLTQPQKILAGFFGTLTLLISALLIHWLSGLFNSNNHENEHT